ncbi:MAG: mycothiol transferase [Acidimicrobiales bacterium]
MESMTLLVDGYQRVREIVHDVVRGLGPDDLAWRPGPQANPIGWLVWHLARVQDHHVADLAGRSQEWEGWAERFTLPFDRSATGYGQPPDETALFRAPADLLAGYHDAVHDATVRYLDSVTAEALDRVVDDRWDPPVTLGVRLVSVLADDLQHGGQAAYVRGLLPGR